jgi:putative oxidoreductase
MVDAVNRGIFYFGRVGIAVLFLPAGIAKFLGPQPFLIHMAAHGVPGELLPVVAAFETLAALALLTGIMLRPMAALAAAFCLLTAFVFHFDFADHVERTMFLKDIAIAGGLFAVFCYRPVSRYMEDDVNYAHGD